MMKRQLLNLYKTFKEGRTNCFRRKRPSLKALRCSLKEKDALLNSIIENADDYLWCIDTERRYTTFNSMVSKVVKETFGADIKPGDNAHQVLKAMDPSMTKEWENLYQSGFQGRPQRLLHEFSFHDQKIFFDVRLQPVRKDNEIIGLSCFAKDITQQMLYNEQLQIAIAKATIDTQEKERNDMGKELHDNVNQMLVTSKLFLGEALKNPVDESNLIKKSIDIINSAIEELRRLSSSLVNPSLGDKSLKEKIYELVTDIEMIRGELIFYDLTTLDEEVLNPYLKTTIFRIIQEQMNNIIKYADASEVRLKIAQEEGILELLIEDNGKGFDLKTKRKGIGIANIISRAQAHNGHVTIDTGPGKGFVLCVRFGLA